MPGKSLRARWEAVSLMSKPMATDQEHHLSTFWSDIDTTCAAKYSPPGASRVLHGRYLPLLFAHICSLNTTATCVIHTSILTYLFRCPLVFIINIRENLDRYCSLRAMDIGSTCSTSLALTPPGGSNTWVSSLSFFRSRTGS